MRKLVWILFVTCSLPIIAQNESTLSLDVLDSLAFSALENNQPTVEQYAKELLLEGQKTGPNLYVINAHTILGIYNKEQGFFESSIAHYLFALDAAEEIKDDKRISACYNNIGSVYQIQGNYKIAKKYFQQSLNIEKQLNQPLQKSIRYYNLAEIYRIQDSLDLALNLFNQSLIIERKYANKIGEIYALIGIAEIYGKLNQLTDATYTVQKINAINVDLPLEPSILLYKLKAQLKFLSKENEAALNLLTKAENICSQNSFHIHLLEIYKDKIVIYEDNKDWENSAAYYKKYIELDKSLNDVKIQNRVNDLMYQNELKKRNLELKLIEEERTLAVKNAEKERSIRNYSGKIIWFLIIAVIVTIFGIYYIYNTTKE